MNWTKEIKRISTYTRVYPFIKYRLNVNWIKCSRLNCLNRKLKGRNRIRGFFLNHHHPPMRRTKFLNSQITSPLQCPGIHPPKPILPASFTRITKHPIIRYPILQNPARPPHSRVNSKQPNLSSKTTPPRAYRQSPRVPSRDFPQPSLSAFPPCR